MEEYPIDPIVINNTATNTWAAVFFWNSVIFFASPSNNLRLVDLLVGASLHLETKTWSAPTTTVDARNAEVTPTANANPNSCTGGKGEAMFAMNAHTVVKTARVRAILSSLNDATQASAG